MRIGLVLPILITRISNLIFFANLISFQTPKIYYKIHRFFRHPLYFKRCYLVKCSSTTDVIINFPDKGQKWWVSKHEINKFDFVSFHHPTSLCHDLLFMTFTDLMHSHVWWMSVHYVTALLWKSHGFNGKLSLLQGVRKWRPNRIWIKLD